MKQVYNLSGDSLPVILAQHDLIIDNIFCDNDYLTMIFEKDISYHDSIKNLNNSKSLIIKIHLIGDYAVYKQKINKIFSKKVSYIQTNIDKIKSKGDIKLEYLYHTVGYQKINIELFKQGYILLILEADYIEFEWIE